MIVIPPALMPIGIASMGVLFGTVGVLVAGPIVVILFVGVRQLYGRDALGEDVGAPPPSRGLPRRWATGASASGCRLRG